MEKETERESKDFFDTVYNAVKGKWHICPRHISDGFIVKMRDIDSEGYWIDRTYDSPGEYIVTRRLYECPECYYQEWIDEPK